MLTCLVLTAVLTVAAASSVGAQTPPFETRKITDTVYLFRYGGHQAIFIVTPDGVIATDPIAYLRPQAASTYMAEIRKVTQASHHHYDHIAGGKPFKDAGAVFVAHRNAKDHLVRLAHPDVVIPDEVVDGSRVITRWTGTA